MLGRIGMVKARSEALISLSLVRTSAHQVSRQNRAPLGFARRWASEFSAVSEVRRFELVSSLLKPEIVHRAARRSLQA